MTGSLKKKMPKRNNVVNLTVHKNTVENRRRKEMRKQMVSSARAMSDHEDFVGYCILGITKSGKPITALNTGGAIPLSSLPEFARVATTAAIFDYFSGIHPEDDEE